MDEIINETLREHETRTDEWLFCQLSNDLYAMFGHFNKRFFDSKLKTPVISFERTRCNNLGHFVLDRNACGLKWNININRLYTDLPLADTLATLLHEMVHQWQQEFGKRKRKSRHGNYHNVEFRGKAKEIGISCNESGVSLFYANPFVAFMKSHGVSVEQRSFVDYERVLPKTRGKSKLKKWTCGCTNVRVAVRDFRAKCLKCGNDFSLDGSY